MILTKAHIRRRGFGHHGELCCKKKHLSGKASGSQEAKELHLLLNLFGRCQPRIELKGQDPHKGNQPSVNMAQAPEPPSSTLDCTSPKKAWVLTTDNQLRTSFKWPIKIVGVNSPMAVLSSSMGSKRRLSKSILKAHIVKRINDEHMQS